MRTRIWNRTRLTEIDPDFMTHKMVYALIVKRNTKPLYHFFLNQQWEGVYLKRNHHEFSKSFL